MAFGNAPRQAHAMRAWAACIVRVLLTFALAFGTVLYAETLRATGAFADEAPAGQEGEGGTDSTGGGTEDPPSDPVNPPTPDPDPGPQTLHIHDIGVFLAGTNRDAYAYASEGSVSAGQVRAVITQPGGEIDFDAAILWDNGSDWEYDSNKVQWRMNDTDTAIASLSPTGVLQAKGTADGVVTVFAFVDGSYTANGAKLAAVFLVELRGQTGARYVSNLQICDAKGDRIEDPLRLDEDLSTAMLELSARVTVVDPKTGDKQDIISTPSRGLSAATDGELPDLVWEVADPRLGTVSEEGVYRPAVTGTNKVGVTSFAGFNGSSVDAWLTVDMPTDGTEVRNYSPQSELIVRLYYKDYPGVYVGEKTFSIEDLERLGTTTRTYTAVGGSNGALTTTGRGPLLVDVLSAAGANPDDIIRLTFDTPDGYKDEVTWDMLVQSDRFYFPNYYAGGASRYAEAEQVPPIVAIDSHRNTRKEKAERVYDLDAQRRFMLLFGSRMNGQEISEKQVYNMHVIYVELSAPPYSPGGKTVHVRFVDSVTGTVLAETDTTDPDKVTPPEAPAHEGLAFKGWSKSTDQKTGDVTYTSVYDEAQPGDGDGGASGGGGSAVPETGGGDSRGDGTADLVSTASEGGSEDAAARAEAAVGADAAEAAVTRLDPNAVHTMSSGRMSVLQAINRHPSNVSDLMLDNPYAPFVAPTAAGFLAAGGLEAFIRFRRQKRLPLGRCVSIG